jgi:hypothetical protein
MLKKRIDYLSVWGGSFGCVAGPDDDTQADGSSKSRQRLKEWKKLQRVFNYYTFSVLVLR